MIRTEKIKEKPRFIIEMEVEECMKNYDAATELDNGPRCHVSLLDILKQASKKED